MSLRNVRRTATAAVITSVLVAFCPVAQADTPTPSPSGLTLTPGTTPSGPVTTPSPTSDAGRSSTSSPSAPVTARPSIPKPSSAQPTTPEAAEPTGATQTPTADTSAAPQSRAEARAPALDLAVTAGGTPVAGRFFEDIGYFAIRGTVSGKPVGTEVEVYWYTASTKRWHLSGRTTTTAGGTYAFNQPVGYASAFAFRTTLGGAPGTSGVTSSNQVSVAVADAYVKQNRPVASIDALKNPTISGTVHPARAGVTVLVQVKKSDKKYHQYVTARTNAKGQYSAALAYAKGRLTTVSVRSAYRATNRPRWEVSAAHDVRRVKKLNAVITKTTAAEVAKTYRRGCPVGPSKLRTITMNYYGYDKVMHRGVMIVRTNLTGRITRGFQKALDAGYPLAKMRNPNDYGGNDPKQMEANNTSGFNCRKVVGNPYAQSPHSYGIAIDVNTVQNPYRDRNGKWWPKNGRKYIDRSPLKKGMLARRSALTKQLEKDDYFWGGLWSPGKDYQHFEYDK